MGGRLNISHTRNWISALNKSQKITSFNGGNSAAFIRNSN
jgi:hypothetical protein